ncbi:MAG: beta-ketoacyl-[acyl-carrier-protein] synthase family protein [Clostridiales bacterium]|nr:beta-ketoacyl-[acyl-carrier-protein] synthase family protein [Clostridiales bacterium]
MKRVVITGIGVICAGASDKETLLSLCTEGVTAIRRADAVTVGGLMTDKFGQADIDDADRNTAMLRYAGSQMMADAGIDSSYIASLGRSCRLFYGTLLSDSEYYVQNSLNKKDGIKSDLLCRMNSYAHTAAGLFGVKGPALISSAACASGTTAAGMALEYISSGICDAGIVGGVDALTNMSAFGFNALRSLSNDICDPYDEKRDGINIGECGAFFFAEELEHAKTRGAHIYCELAGFASGNDAYHITSPEPEGKEAVKVMEAALADAGIAPDKLDYINGHGTGTPINDSMEKKAVDALFEGSNHRPFVSSTKAMVGHCMGASGAVELASVIMSMNSGRPIRMPRLEDPIDGSDMFNAPGSIDIEYAMSNSFAFAGNSASLIIKRYEEDK